jgi:hypothetical protein
MYKVVIMKKIILFPTILASIVIPSILLGFSGSGSGTKEDPYQITNLSQLQEMNYNLSAHYILMNDIDAADTKNWNSGKGFVPIGSFTWEIPTEGFTGKLDGQGYTISGLYVNRPDEDYIGLFGCIADEGYVYNLNIEDSEVTGHNCVGIFVGSTYAYKEVSELSIDRCSFIGGKVYGYGRVGGFCGQNYTNEGKASISYCFAICDVVGDNNLGGFCGQNMVIEGIASILYCYANGDVMGTTYYSDHVGGFCGANGADKGTASISYCYANGDASGGVEYVGGFCGVNYIHEGIAIISDCFATGDAIVSENYVGGFCGGNNAYNSSGISMIERCYSIGIPEGKTYIGGFCGELEGIGTSEINYCFWDIEASLYTNSDGGIGKTTNQMKTQNTFETWDFDDVWCMAEGKSYPQLQYFVDCDTLTSVIEERYDNEIEIYPNPAGNYIEISFGRYSVNKGLQPLVHVDEFKIYDVLGTKVMTVGAIHELPLQRIDISNLPRGVYFVRIGDRVEKFVKR